MSTLNGQDLVDIKEVKELERLAKNREDQNVTRDDEYLMEDDTFLTVKELKEKNKERWLDANKNTKLLS